MSFFNFNSTKKIELDFCQIRFAHVVVQLSAAFIRTKSETHKSLSLKIERAKNVARSGQVVKLEVNEAEKKLMREYNDQYCEILSDRMKRHDLASSKPDYTALEAYSLATEVQLLFSSIR